MSARFNLSAFGLLLLAACNAGDPPANQAPDQVAEPAKGNLTAAATPPPHAAGRSNAQEPAQAKLEDLDSSTNASTPAARDPTAVTRSWFAGRWTDSGDCADAATFASNGTYVLADGTRGMWNVQDSHLVIQNSGGRNVVRVRRVGDDAVETIDESGNAGRSTRC